MAVTYVAAGTRSNSAGATSRAPALPTRSNGDFLIAVIGAKNNETHSVSGTGWSALGTQVNSGTGWTVSLWQCLVNGSEATPTVSWTSSVACFGQVIQFRGTSLTNIVGNILSNSGTTSTHSCNAITTTQANSLVIYIDAAAANTAIAQPTGWTERLDGGSATGATRNANGDKTVASSGGSSGNISVTGANAAWVMWQIELHERVTLSVQEGNHAHSADNLSLASNYTLSVQDALSALESEAAVIIPRYSIIIEEASHALGSDNASPMFTNTVLIAARGYHTHSAEVLTLYVDNGFIPSGSGRRKRALIIRHRRYRYK